MPTAIDPVKLTGGVMDTACENIMIDGAPVIGINVGKGDMNRSRIALIVCSPERYQRIDVDSAGAAGIRNDLIRCSVNLHHRHWSIGLADSEHHWSHAACYR